MNTIGQFLTSLFAVTGGITASVVLLLKFGGKWFANYLQARYEAAIEKELETYKVKLDSRQHVTKKRFDKEFEIYEMLSSSFYRVLKTVELLIPEDSKIEYPVDPEERKKFIQDGYAMLSDELLNAKESFFCFNFFIIEEAEYEKMLELLEEQKVSYQQVLKKHSTTYLSEDDFQRTKNLWEMYRRTNISVRSYLRQLEVA